MDPLSIYQTITKLKEIIHQFKRAEYTYEQCSELVKSIYVWL